MNQHQREVAAMQYLAALENADFDALMEVLGVAEEDREFEEMILELQAEWAAENDAQFVPFAESQKVKRPWQISTVQATKVGSSSKVETAQLQQQAESFIKQYNDDEDVLLIIAEFYSGPTTGFDALSSAKKSGIKLTAGTLFRLLPQLVRDGLLIEVTPPAKSDSKKQYYQATSLGRKVAKLLVKRERARSQSLYAYYSALFGI